VTPEQITLIVGARPVTYPKPVLHGGLGVVVLFDEWAVNAKLKARYDTDRRATTAPP
jgi:hypothetical protein